MKDPLDNSLSESHVDPRLTDSQEEVETRVLPEVFKGRMFCVVHGRECYRTVSVAGEDVWVCPDERHSRPLT